MSIYTDIKREFISLEINKRQLRSFGFLFFAVGCIISASLYKHHNIHWREVCILGSAFLIAGIFCPNSLKYFYKGWMIFALVLGWIMTRTLLAVTFYAVFTPTGLILKLFGKDILDEKIDKNTATYWKKYSVETNKENYRKQF